METPNYSECEQALAELGSEHGAAEFHGLLCGLLCRGEGLEQARQEAAVSTGSQLPVLQALTQGSLVALRSNQSSFTPLLPEDDARLDLRVTALAEWCEAFLHGIVLKPGLQMQALSKEAQELIEDLTQLSRAGLTQDDDAQGESEERDYAELVEYLRVAAQLLFIELSENLDDAEDRSLSGGSVH